MIKKFRFIISAISLFSMLFITTVSISAAPVRFNQVKQFVNVKPGKANAGNFTQLKLSDKDNLVKVGDDGDTDSEDNTATQEITQQDDRVIKTTTVEVIEEEDCNCPPVPEGGGISPYWALLGLGAIPAGILLARLGDDDPTPTPNPTGTPGMTPSPTVTPTATPTGSPTPTPTETPGMTPTPTPTTEPIPEPMTILLFGTGLAGVGLAARKKFGRREEEEEGEE